jgi:hypothetical protein
VALKAAGLCAAAGLFAHVSWRLWPARLFAGADELETHRLRFRRSAAILTAIVALEFVLGAAAAELA